MEYFHWLWFSSWPLSFNQQQTWQQQTQWCNRDTRGPKDSVRLGSFLIFPPNNTKESLPLENLGSFFRTSKVWGVLRSWASLKLSRLRHWTGLTPGLINLRERWASLAGTNCHTSTFCRHFSSKSVYDYPLQSIFYAGTFFSDLCSQTQNTFNEACLTLLLIIRLNTIKTIWKSSPLSATI